MSDNSLEDTIYVTYQGNADTRFDRDYYVERHLPLVMRSWESHGLKSIKAFFPSSDESGTIAICECIFRDEAATEAAFAAAETPAVMADVAQFTDVEPIRFRAKDM
ncbi:EthD family reductase [Paraburkholderia sp. J41]|uniref:EthD family reductase n=1 Tax=Paraburkholderia sp. J41 TaxID=2805433 RepID=UPI002AC31589|nr:EthD family reductase [Paraburkholderia sp. J41]